MTVVCAQCSVEFTPRRVRKDQPPVCCSSLCARRRNVQRAQRRSCEVRDMSGANNPMFKGWASKRPYVYVKRFVAANPEKRRVQYLLHYAVKHGHVVRPSACSLCGVACRPDGHHDDYSQPLDVTWACRKCHVGLDAARRQREQHGQESTNATA